MRSFWKISPVCAGLCLAGSIVAAADFQIVAESDPKVVTHELESGGLILGISDQGGGYINRLYLPGIGEVMGTESARYGRGGQSSIRDALHGGRYNPTQAGFSDYAGTQCEVRKTEDGGKLVVLPRPCCLYRGDGKFDFTEWENLADDRYREEGGRKDWDTIDETGLKGKQATEVTSEFDYYCTYENRKGWTAGHDDTEISIPCIRHYFEYRYVRDPGHCIEQHNLGPLYNPNAGEVTDISNSQPSGVHEATKDDLGIVILSMSIRMDRSLWTPAYVAFVDSSDPRDLHFTQRTSKAVPRNVHDNSQLASRTPAYRLPKAPQVDVSLFILADSTDPDKEGALGLYYPDGDINRFPVIGVDRESGEPVYKDDRWLQLGLLDTPRRTGKMQWCGFRGRLLGLLNPTRLPDNQYEAIRGEFYILYGSPRQILENAARIQSFQ